MKGFSECCVEDDVVAVSSGVYEGQMIIPPTLGGVLSTVENEI